MIAILLAAGVGRRLRPFTDRHPKVLLEIHGRTLLERHLDALASVGVAEVAIVVGHCQDQIRAAVERRPDAARVTFLENREYERGSVLSLHRARHLLDGHRDGSLVMDADVLYPREALRRLVDAPGSAFLLDASAHETGEEMMLGVRDGLVRTIDRRIGEGWDLKGEGVGFFKITARDAPLLRAELERSIALGETASEYEDALRRFLGVRPAGYVPADDLAWTEIDFAEDVARARELAPAVDATYAAAC